MSLLSILLIFSAPILALGYALGEHYGLWDRLTGRCYASEGFSRLKSTAGYPTSWIYDDEQDRKQFNALEKRISKKMKENKVLRDIALGKRPSLITVGGLPVNLTGIPNDWPQEQRSVYLSSHPVMYIFGIQRSSESPQNGNGERVCSLADIEKWLQEEKDNRKFYLGTVIVGLISLAILFVRSTNVIS